MHTTMRLEMLLSTCARPRRMTCDVAYLGAQMDNLGAQMDNLGAQMDNSGAQMNTDTDGPHWQQQVAALKRSVYACTDCTWQSA